MILIFFPLLSSSLLYFLSIFSNWSTTLYSTLFSSTLLDSIFFYSTLLYSTLLYSYHRRVSLISFLLFTLLFFFSNFLFSSFFLVTYPPNLLPSHFPIPISSLSFSLFSLLTFLSESSLFSLSLPTIFLVTFLSLRRDMLVKEVMTSKENVFMLPVSEKLNYKVSI